MIQATRPTIFPSRRAKKYSASQNSKAGFFFGLYVSTIYNYPYYPQHLEHYGYTHDVDWVERKIFVPENGHEADRHPD